MERVETAWLYLSSMFKNRRARKEKAKAAEICANIEREIRQKAKMGKFVCSDDVLKFSEQCHESSMMLRCAPDLFSEMPQCTNEPVYPRFLTDQLNQKRNFSHRGPDLTSNYPKMKRNPRINFRRFKLPLFLITWVVLAKVAYVNNRP